VTDKAWALAHFYDFLLARYQGDIHVLTGTCWCSRSTSSTGRPSRTRSRRGSRYLLQRLTRWLEYRDTRWPNTANNHLFLHYRTACRPDTAVGHRWVWLTIGAGLTGKAIREDRILNEAHATDGDVRRLVDLFGLSVNASTRYTNTIEHPDLTQLDTAEGDGVPHP